MAMNSAISVSTPPPSEVDVNFSIAKCSQAILHAKNANALWIHNRSKLKQKREPYWKITNIAAPKPMSLKLSSIKPHLALSHSVTVLAEDTDTDYSSSSSFTMSMEAPQTNHNYDNLKRPNPLNLYCDSTDYNQSDTDDDDKHDNANYDYPWSPSSDDSFVDLTEHEVYAKIKEKFRKEAEYNLKIVSKMKENDENESDDMDTNVDIKTPKNCVNPKTGSYLSFIINNDSPIADECEYEGDIEDDLDVKQGQMSPLIPMQSICNSVELDISGCSLTDVE